MTDRFSDRQGYRASNVPITIREDAPPALRAAVPLIARDAGMRPASMRELICEVFLVMPDPDNWSEYPNIWNEVARLMEEASWYKVYDVAEVLYAALVEYTMPDTEPADEFERRLNDFLMENGIGWELRNGQITWRGSEVFAKSTHEVPEQLDDSGHTRAANELREALLDISRRPEPDVTGAVQHAMAALEATAREVGNEPNLTLGKLVPLLELPAPLDQAVHKLWGFASDRGRHIREGQAIEEAEAELVVAVAGALCAFLAQRRP